MHQLIKNFLLGKGLAVSRTTGTSRILDLMSRLRPNKTEHDLIRLGGHEDGGYLVPDDLDGIEVCFSPGVSETATFEEDLARRGIRCFLADHSVDAPPVKNALFEFDKKFLGPSDSDIYMTLDSWVDMKTSSTSDMILQMDIEGAEYGVILSTKPETLRRFRILVVEFHALDSMFNPSGHELINLRLTKILHDFDVVHIHANNCCGAVGVGEMVVPRVMEFTFLRKDRIQSRAKSRRSPTNSTGGMSRSTATWYGRVAAMRDTDPVRWIMPAASAMNRSRRHVRRKPGAPRS